MSQKKRGPELHQTEEKTGAGRWVPVAVVSGVLCFLAALVLWSGRGTPPKAPSPAPAAADAAANDPTDRYAKLVGRWQRPDGGYIIDVRSAGPDGKLEASYFNPNPIHVARAEASGQGAMVKVFIELRDVNYPGSTYTLAYDRENDILKGIYFQALERQEFEVYFQRIR